MARRIDRLLLGVSRSALGAAFALALTVAPASADNVKTFNIPVQEATTAVRAFGQQAGLQILASVDDLKGKRVNAVVGQLDVDAALRQLLAGTGLTWRATDANTILIEKPRAAAAAAPEPPSQTPASNEPATGANDQPEGNEQGTEDNRTVEKVTVTGSRIKGARPSSPVITITGDEMRKSGHNNLGEVVRALPQNFAGGQNPGVATGAAQGASAANFNATGSSSVNLRGLGPDATLTLLNGNRLPYDGYNQATDVSVIPVAAIERVEVLLDGASAIYGSDAVGGVVNIVLRRDYDGAEFSARLGAATDGGYEQQQYTAVAGKDWGSGGFLITGDYSDNDPVKARHRDYLRYMTNQNVDIYPESSQTGTLLSGHQALGEWAGFNLDTFYTERTQHRLDQLSASSVLSIGTDSSIWGVSPSFDIRLPGDWSARLHGAFGRNEAEFLQTTLSVATGAPISSLLAEYFNGMQAVGVEAEGPLFALPGGPARLSIGGGYRSNSFDRRTVNLLAGTVSGVVAAEESSNHLYGEVNLPLVSEDQGIPLIERLSLNAALRHEDYDSFGESTTPKIGAIWEFAPGFDLKASWGKSFKVPTLSQQYQKVDLFLYPPAILGGVGAPPGSQVLALFGSAPDLEPETAEIVTAGFVARPAFLQDLTLEVSYFDIDYTDRVDFPIDVFSQALSNPAYAAFVTLSPTVAQQNAAFAAAGLPVGTVVLNLTGAPYNPANVMRSSTIASRTSQAIGSRASISMRATRPRSWTET